MMLASLAGCGLTAEKHIDYQPGAVQAAALEVPPDLTRPVNNEIYKMPAAFATPAKLADGSSDLSLQAEESGVSNILIKAPFDQSWRRVGLAIETLKLTLEDKDRSKGNYFLQPIKASSIALPKEASDTHYRVLVQDNGATCIVTVIAADGISDTASKLVLDALYKNIRP